MKKSPALMNKYYLIFMLIGFAHQLWGQIDTSLLLPSVEIKATSVRQNPIGERTEKWDSTQLTNFASTNIAEVLQQQSGIFIKSYGGGSLATSSIRGGSAGHTAVLWNGFSIQSPMLGLLDMALLPVALIDNMEVQYGGNSALWGGGAIGGLINLNNKAIFKQGLKGQLQLSGGNFGKKYLQTKWHYSNSKMAASIRYFHQRADNDFFYTIRPDLPPKQQTHAQFLQNALMAEYYWKIHSKQQLSLWGWWQTIDRQIPPLTTQSVSMATQQDSILRIGTQWQFTGNQWIWQARSAFLKETQHYQDPLAGVNGLNHFWTNINETVADWHFLNNQKLHLGTNYTFTKASARAYGEAQTENRLAFFAAYLLNLEHFRLRLSARQEWYNGQNVPIMPSIAVEKRLTKWLNVKSKITRNYRLPTLNDRFWNPGGNPNLLPESGWSEEVTLEVSKKLNLGRNLMLMESRGLEDTAKTPSKTGEIWGCSSETTTIETDVTTIETRVTTIEADADGQTKKHQNKFWKPRDSKLVPNLKYQLTFFNRNIQNWIIWLRQENAIWSPRNVAAVWSRGIEQRLNLDFAIQSFYFKLNGGYDYIRSTNQKTENPAALDKQLIYTPVHQAFGGLSVQWKNLRLAYQHRYTGNVFIRADNSLELEKYALGFLQTSWSKDWKRFRTRLFLKIDNVWNVSYRVIERRAMAGRNGEIGLSFYLR